MKEVIEVKLDETNFTILCKIGHFTRNTPNGDDVIYFSKTDIKNLYNRETVIKTSYHKYEIDLLLNDKYLIKEIIRRSPIFSDLYDELI